MRTCGPPHSDGRTTRAGKLVHPVTADSTSRRDATADFGRPADLRLSSTFVRDEPVHIRNVLDVVENW